ncbi:MAG: hypothetical protein ABR500_01680 [Dermatophilaceae bacterium]|nr:hypothetical protein [Intrasporangiaceae bacterium]
MSSGEAERLLQRTPMRLRGPITIMLVAIVVIGALVPWLGIAQAWLLTGNPEFRGVPGQGMSRWLFLAEVLQYWPLQAGAGSTVVAMAAALSLVAICGSWAVRAATLGRRRVAFLVVVVAIAFAVLALLSRLILVLYPMTLTWDELPGLSLAERDGLTIAQSLLGLSAEMLAWTVVLMVGATCWPRGDMALADDGHVAAGEVGGEDVADRNMGERNAPAEVSPVEEQKALGGPDQGPREPVDPARLRRDGSSDSGFDEFHFRR